MFAQQIKQSILRHLLERIQYIVGFTQLTLRRENHAIWMLSILVSTVQKLAIIKLSDQVMGKYTNQVTIGGNSDLTVMFKASVPLVYMTEALSVEYLVMVQGFVMLFNLIPVTMVGYSMYDEHEFFIKQKYKNNKELKLSQTDNLTDCIQLMNQIYNQNSYIEGFQHRLMQNSESQSHQLLRLQIISIFINYYPHVLLLPQLYFLLEVDMLARHQADLTFSTLLFLFNSFIIIQVIVISLLSLLWVQQSYSTFDTNHLKLRTSPLTYIHMILAYLPIIITYFYGISSPDAQITQGSVVNVINLGFIIAAFIVDAIDNYIYMPYMTRFKYITIVFTRQFVGTLTICELAQLNDKEIITLTIALVPLLTRLFTVLMDRRVDDILTMTLRKEKNSLLLDKTVLIGLKIENENYKYKEFQAVTLRQVDQRMFIHFLRAYQLLNLKEIGVLTRFSGIKLVQARSKLLLASKVLLKQHSENCVNCFCYCRGIKGDKRKIIDKYEIVKEMRMYDDFRILNIQFYVELIMRYVRDYCKLIFQIEIAKHEPDILYLIQLLSFMMESEECYQCQLLILELEHVMATRNPSLQHKMALKLLLSSCKFNVLLNMKDSLVRQQIEKTLLYEDYRFTELKRDKLIQRIHTNLHAKRVFLNKLNNGIHTYESLEHLYITMSRHNIQTEQKLQKFNDHSHSRTSLFCYMFYCLEVTNNYDKFTKLVGALTTTESKFFEHPQFYFNTEEQAYKVGYMLVTLTQSHHTNKRGEILSFSKNIPVMLDYSADQFKQQVPTLDQMLTPSLVVPHDEMVEIFVMTSRPRQFRAQVQVLAQQRKPGHLCFLDSFIDINFNYVNGVLPCYVFLKEIKQSVKTEGLLGHILIDSNLKIEGFTQAAFEAFGLESMEDIYHSNVVDLIPSFPTMAHQLNEMLSKHIYQNQTTGAEALANQTLITQDSLIHQFKAQFDNVQVIVKQDGCKIDYQIDIELVLCYCKVSKQTYQVYQVIVKTAFRLDGICSDESPLSKSLDEFTTSSKDNIKFKQYVANDEPIITLRGDPFTQRSQLNQTELEDKPLRQSKQIEYMCSDHLAQIHSVQDSSHRDEQSQQQNDNKQYINSLSSASSKQSDLQKILLKSHIYGLFAKMESKPLILHILLGLNIYSLVVILVLFAVNSVLYTLWQADTRNNISILQAFTITQYSRSTLQGTMILLQYVTEEEIEDTFIWNPEQLQLLQDVLRGNIANFLDSMDDYTQNQIIRQVFSTTKLQQIDVYDNTIKDVDGWTALFQLMYMMELLNLKSENDETQFIQSLVYLLKSYKQYKDAYSVLQVQFQAEVQAKLDTQYQNLDTITFISITFLVVYFAATFIMYASYFGLIKKFIRCCEQISHIAIEEDIQIVSQHIANFKEIESFDLYECNFNIKDKFNIDQEKVASGSHRVSIKPTQLAVTQNTQNTKKFLKIQDQFSVIRMLFFLNSNLKFCVFVIVLAVLRSIDQSLIASLESKLQIYQECITFTEALSETCLTNFAVQGNSYLTQLNILDEVDADIFMNYSNTTYHQANDIISGILLESTGFSTALKVLLDQNICLKQTFKTECESLQEGTLTEGLLIPLQNLFSIIRENIDIYVTTKKATQKMQMDDILVQSFIIDAVQDFVDEIRLGIEGDILTSNNQKSIMTVFLSIFIVVLGFAQIYYLRRHLNSKVFLVRQFVYILPSRSLYLEDSFFKTLTFMEKNQNKLIHI